MKQGNLMVEWSARILLALGLLLPLVGNADQLYRYRNAQGVQVLDRLGVPSEFIGNGYEVLNEQGRVIEVIPPAPSAEERQRLVEEKAKASSDAQLMRLYSTLEDVDRALARKLLEIDGVITVARSNQRSLRNQQRNLQSQAAELERSGRPVPEHLLVQLNNLKSEQLQLDKDIARYQGSRAASEAAFAADRARLAELLSRQ